MIPGVNRRIHPRKVLRGPVTIVMAGQSPREGKVWDVGLDGMSVISPRPIAPGTRCTFRFDVPTGDTALSVSASVKVLYCSYSGPEGFKVGTSFAELDADALEAVRQFTS